MLKIKEQSTINHQSTNQKVASVIQYQTKQTLGNNHPTPFKQWKQRETLFSWALKSLQMVTADMKLKDAPWKKSYDKPRQHIKKQRHYFTNKGPSSQGYGFSSNYVWM